MQLLKRLLPIVLAVTMLMPVVTPAYADTVYVVQTGDTLYQISVKFGVSMADIMAANGIANSNLIYVGQRLVIPSTSTGTGTSGSGTGSVYVVQTGDTLYKISVKFGVSMANIMSANGLTNPNIVYVGQRLMIPPAGGAAAPTPVPATPGAAATPVATLTPIPTGTTYIVQAGDTLGRIAQKFGVSLSTLMSINGITNANLIFVGQRLVISGAAATPAPTAGAATPTPLAPTPGTSAGTVHVVARGETLWAISMKYNVSVAAIKTANGLTSDYIYVGQRLVIPASGTTPTAPTATPVPGATAVPTKAPTAAPTVVVPPVSSGSFELGGQVVSISSAADKMKWAGMTWVKVQQRWSPGAWPDGGRIQEAHSQGFKILLSVLGDPADISGGANFDAYADYVGELARLGADAIEIWNEMNIDREWPAGQINPVTYTDLLRRSYTKIKAKNAGTLVISGAPAPTGAEGAFGADHVWNDNRYMAGLEAAGAANYMDCIGVHYNEGILSPTRSSGDPRQDYYTRYYSGMVSTYYNAFGGARKLCFTELGYLTGEGYGALPGAFGWAGSTTVAQQAQWLGEAANLSRSGGVVRLMIVFNVDFTVWGDDPQAGYAIIRPGGNCPACDSLRAVTGGR